MKFSKGQAQSATVDIDSQDRVTVESGSVLKTFDIKEELKGLGMKWDGRVWYYKPQNDDDAVSFLKKLNEKMPGLECYDADMVEFVNGL